MRSAYVLRVLAGVAMLIGTAATAAPITTPGAYIDEFQRTTNDGVYSLSAAQAEAIGVVGATKLALLRVRPSRGVTWEAGDYFDAASIENTIRGSGANVFGILNGPLAPGFVPQATNGDVLLYEGDLWEALGTTIFQQDSGSSPSLVAAVAVAFTGTLTVNGVSTFNPVTLGAAPISAAAGLAAVPLPAAGWLLMG
ncbi:MAG: hypothetical protein AAFT19_04895, partial [Pseudomonadota bacterium]